MYQSKVVRQTLREHSIEPNRSGKAGRYLNVLNWASEYGLSLDVYGREWVRVTPRSASRNAKERAGMTVNGLGFHSEKRAAVRDPRFRALAPAVQEQLAGTSYTTLKNVYDEVSPDDLREAQREPDRRWG